MEPAGFLVPGQDRLGVCAARRGADAQNLFQHLPVVVPSDNASKSLAAIENLIGKRGQGVDVDPFRPVRRL